MAERRSASALRRRSLLRRAFVLNADNIGGRVISGAGFQFLGIGLRTLVTIGSTAILARLLTPADFGYVAMATVVTELAALFSNFGLTNLLIQRRIVTRLQLDTVFWASLGLGGVLALVVFVASFFAGWVFSDQSIGPLLRVLCMTFLFGGLTAVPWVVLARLMRFRTEFLMQITTVVGRTLVAIALAYAGWGVWSLVVAAVVGAVMQAALGFLAVPYWPRLRFHLSYLASTWRTSGSYFAGGLLYYANMNIDLMLIGRHLGAAPLGHYQTARSLTDEIRARIAIPLQHVLFPALSAAQTDLQRLQNMVVRSGRVMAAVVIPIGVGVSATAPELVPVLYGSKWLEMIPVMSMFGLSAALKAATAVAGPLFNACDRVALALKYNIIGSALMAVAVFIALPHGLNVVAAAIVLVTLYSVLTFRVALGLIGLGGAAVWEILGPPAIASALMWAAVAALRPASAGVFAAPAALLLCHAAIAGLVYVAALHLLSRQYLRDFMQLADQLLKRR